MEQLTEIAPLLPPRLAHNVHSIMRKVRTEDWDWLWVVDGRERVGKTALSLLILFTAEPELYDMVIAGDYDIPLARFSWDFDAMLDTVRSLPSGSALCYQEASMLGREAMKQWNIRMIRVMTTIGSRNILYLLTFPKFSMLDPYLRLRARTRTRVRTHHHARGYARCYYRATDSLVDDLEGMRYAFDTTFRNVSIEPTLKEFWALLQEKERSVKDEILERHGRRSSTD